MENLVYRKQAEYYTALSQSTAQADSAPFIEFMLSMISQALKEQINTPQATPQAVLDIINKYPDLTQYATKPRSRQELQLFCGLNDREHFRKTVPIPKLLGNAEFLGLSGITRQGAVCSEWLAIRNNCNAVLWFQTDSKNCIFK